MSKAFYSTILLVLFTISISFSQFDNYQEFNFTVEDGLPSNECHDILQDSLGYIWIATDRGLSRFDGYGFKNYGKSEGLGNISCLFMEFDRDQNIYIGTYGGDIYVYLRATDKIVPYRHQHIIDSFGIHIVIIELYVDNKNNFYLNIASHGLLRINEVGESMLYDLVQRDSVHPEVIIENRIFAGNYGKSLRLFDSVKLSFYQNELIIEVDTTIIRRKLEMLYRDFLQLNTGEIYASCAGKIEFYEDINDLINNNKVELFKDIRPARFCLDQYENIWLGTMDNGVLLFKKNELKYLNDLKIHGAINKLALKDSSTVYVLTNRAQVWEYNLNSNEITVLYENTSGNLIFDLVYNRITKELIVVGRESVFVNVHGEIRGIRDIRKSMNDVAEIFVAKSVEITDDGFALFNTFNALVLKDKLDEKELLLIGNDFIMACQSFHFIDKNNYYLGTNLGIYHYEYDSLKRMIQIPSLIDIRVTEIEKFRDGLIASTLGSGISFFIGDDFIENITKKEGLISDNIEDLFVKNDTVIYAVSKQGLSIITYNDHGNYSIQNLTAQLGLPSNVVTDVEFLPNGNILIATEKGIVEFSGDVKVIEATIPQIESVFVNDTSRSNSIFSYHENNFVINYRSIDMSQLSSIKYRYKLNEQDWKYTDLTTVNYPSLSPNDYKFEVQASNANIVWSASQVFNFRIKPSWWTSWWALTTWGVIVMLFVIKYFKWRMDSINEKAKIREEIRNLEMSALQAQMNPHFIFNCLNSIQNFIMTNEKDLAMDYLAQFARLIRQSLNASVESKVSLENEIKMLNNYLSLEKLRFKNKFDFVVRSNNISNKENIFIAPLLIQPFVENAVIHGMEGIESNGLIEVSFSRNKNKLLVSITDNGTGVRKTDSTTTRKSLGMSITNKRLTHINGTNNSTYRNKLVSGENGTSIELEIELLVN